MPYRDSTRTSDVMAPSHTSRNSTMSDFDRDNDTLELPRNKQASSHRNSRFQRASQYAEQDLDYAIDTSALRDALPEFSDGRSAEGEEEEEDESDGNGGDDISIEIGRGGRKTGYRMDDSRDSFMSLDDSRLTASPAGAVNDNRQSSQGARHALRNVSNRGSQWNKDGLRKDAQIRRASLVAQKENIDPRASRTRKSSSGQQEHKQQRRTLSDMHAKVAEAYDGSYLSDERPPSAQMATTKNTRFGSSKTNARDRVAQAVSQAAAGDSQSTKRQQKNSPWPDASQQESFVLPDLENLSELVSGIYQEGEAVNARQSRPRTTRFTSPPAVEISEPEGHAHFAAVPIPEDEKAIFSSLRLLQRKVSALEHDNTDVESKLEELRQENMRLRAQQLPHQKNKSDGQGMDDDEARGGAATLAVEKNRLEAANSTLQKQLESAKHKLSGHESSVHQAKQERNSVVNQLGTAYLSCQELKADNETLRRENEGLKEHLATLTGFPEDNHRNDATRASAGNRRSNYQPAGDATEATRRTSHQQVNDRENRTREHDTGRDDALFSLDLPPRRNDVRERSRQIGHAESTAEKMPNTSRQRTKKLEEEYDGTESQMTMDVRDLRAHAGTRDLTYLSFVDSREIAQLRKTLEEERIARKHGHVAGQDKFKSRIESLTQELTTKSSFKDATHHSSKSVPGKTNATGNSGFEEANDDETTENRDLTSSHKEDLTRATSRRGHRDGTIEVTSAFILPDITMHAAAARGAGNTGAARSKGDTVHLSSTGRRILDQTVRHERDNCTVCHKDSPEQKSSVEIPSPAPVSDRAPVPSGPAANGDEHDQTLRPSEPPSRALAKVLMNLEDELAHLKMRLAVCQSRYARHDAAVGKRKRVRLGEEMRALVADIEGKSEVVYALYDVLEGQKANQNRKADRDGGVGEDDDGEDELPWEGFESTEEVTGRSRMRT